MGSPLLEPCEPVATAPATTAPPPSVLFVAAWVVDVIAAVSVVVGERAWKRYFVIPEFARAE